MDDPTDPDVELPRPLALPTWRDLRTVVDRRVVAVAAVGVLAALGVAVGAWALLRTPPAPPIELSLPYASDAEAPAVTTPTSSTVATELVVHAAGAVVTPGVVRVPAGSRVAEVLAAAGGPLPDADVDAVNLAALVSDGDRVWFPRRGEVAPGQAVGPVGATGADSTAPVAPLDLNAATAEELDALPGVGPAIAAAIVDHRERDGPFRSVDDLLDVPGIGDAKLAQLRDLVRV